MDNIVLSNEAIRWGLDVRLVRENCSKTEDMITIFKNIRWDRRVWRLHRRSRGIE